MHAIAIDNMSERLLLIQVNDGRRSSLCVCVLQLESESKKVFKFWTYRPSLIH